MNICAKTIFNITQLLLAGQVEGEALTDASEADSLIAA